MPPEGGGGGGGGDERVKALGTLRTSLSGTFLQTLPDLVTPLKASLYLRAAVQRRGQRPPKGLGTDQTPNRKAVFGVWVLSDKTVEAA